MSWGLETVNAVGWWVESKPRGAAMAEAAARFKRASYAWHLDHISHACFETCRSVLRVSHTGLQQVLVEGALHIFRSVYFLNHGQYSSTVRRVLYWLYVFEWCTSTTPLHEPLHTWRLHLHHPARSRHVLPRPSMIYSATETIFPLRSFKVYLKLCIIHKGWACTPLSAAVPHTELPIE